MSRPHGKARVALAAGLVVTTMINTALLGLALKNGVWHVAALCVAMLGFAAWTTRGGAA